MDGGVNSNGELQRKTHSQKFIGGNVYAYIAPKVWGVRSVSRFSISIPISIFIANVENVRRQNNNNRPKKKRNTSKLQPVTGACSFCLLLAISLIVVVFFFHSLSAIYLVTSTYG